MFPFIVDVNIVLIRKPSVYVEILQFTPHSPQKNVGFLIK